MTLEFLKAWARDRGIKTFIQVFFGVLILEALPGATEFATVTPAEFVALPWATALASASLVTFLSFGMALANPSFVEGKPAADE